MRVLPWLQIAALTLEHPETLWKAVIIAKAPKVKSTAKVPPPQALFAFEEFVIAGENAEERKESALRVFKFANAIRTRARRVPLPMFERSSWILDKAKSHQEGELKFDLDRPSHVLVFGGRELEDFKCEPLIEEIDLGLPISPSRFEAYAAWLADNWAGTVSVLTAAEIKKTKAAGKKAKTSSTEIEDEEVVD
jgi:hypothetical protein